LISSTPKEHFILNVMILALADTNRKRRQILMAPPSKCEVIHSGARFKNKKAGAGANFDLPRGREEALTSQSASTNSQRREKEQIIYQQEKHWLLWGSWFVPGPHKLQFNLNCGEPVRANRAARYLLTLRRK
jgi:hypothetical protein